MRSIRRVAMAAAGAVALSGCSSDPEFWEAVAAGLDQAAYDLANQPVCSTYVNSLGMVQQHCAPAWQNQPAYVIDYSRGGRDHYRSRDHYRDDDRHRGGRRDGRDRRDDGGRDPRGPKRDR